MGRRRRLLLTPPWLMRCAVKKFAVAGRWNLGKAKFVGHVSCFLVLLAFAEVRIDLIVMFSSDRKRASRRNTCCTTAAAAAAHRAAHGLSEALLEEHGPAVLAAIRAPSASVGRNETRV
jgi:hypothetical protein